MVDVAASIKPLDASWIDLTVPEGDTLSLKFANAPPGAPRLIVELTETTVADCSLSVLWIV